MRCESCGAGLTGLPNGKWWCSYCNIEYAAETLKVKTLDKFIEEVAKHGNFKETSKRYSHQEACRKI